MTKMKRTSSQSVLSRRSKSSRLPERQRATTTKKVPTTKKRLSASTSSSGRIKGFAGTSNGTASSPTSSSSPSITDGQTSIPASHAAPKIRVLCAKCGGLRAAGLHRVDRAVVQGIEVTRALVYLCETCNQIAATPQVTGGRVFAAKENERKGTGATELRISAEAEDLAYAVYAALGLRPTGDVFALPIGVGLLHVSSLPKADAGWSVLDGCEKALRARPVLSDEVLQRLEGLQKQWDAPDRSTVARWLLVAGAKAIGVI